ncbi:MAG: glucose-6-phosphate isomerase [Gammaproteobacteria bacterium]|nr:glucose-6-phosphate isomerase [Gammaproteobacteria bacterium]
MTKLSERHIWSKLQQHYQMIKDVHMRDMFEQDAQRFEQFSLKLNDILFDYSKNRISSETMDLLLQLARDSDLENWIKRMFGGEIINHTEQRAVLHVALRNCPQSGSEPMTIGGEDVMPEVCGELKRVKQLAESVRTRCWRGVTGQPITDVVNIGIGGSHLGPLMATEALRPYAIRDLHIHYVSNIDENHINDTLETLNPETTLFIVSSKSFTTQDTMVNAMTARKWLLRKIEDESELHRHFVAVTANIEAAMAFGIAEANVFKMWDWVGGRYSMWSAIGLSIVIAIGSENFDALLQGAYAADQHFRHTPFEQNIPVIMALLGIWYNNFFGSEAIAILPYDQHLHRFPAYLQQADMESNGKAVDRDGQAVDYSTGPILFGEIGIASQHAFYQLLHQGTKLVPADMLAPISNFRCIAEHHRALMSNVFAQTEAMMKGKTRDEVYAELKATGLNEQEIEKLLPYKIFPGNRPTNTFLFKTLDPKTLGSLIALYEHKIFVQGVIWNLNSFDQWGVELGKHLATSILHELNDLQPVRSHDSSTNGLINYYKANRPLKGG